MMYIYRRLIKERDTDAIASSYHMNPRLWNKKIDSMKIWMETRADMVSRYSHTHMLKHAIWKCNMTCVKLLIENGADVNARCNYGDPMLQYAIRSNNIACVRLMIEKGADVNARCNLSRPVLEHAIRSENMAFVKLLIENGADVNARCNNGDPMLLHAFRNDNNIECVKLLIENGADVNTRCRYGDPILLQYAFRRDRVACIKLLIENGANVNARCRNGDPMLQHAIRRKQNEYVKLLIESGAYVNARCHNDEPMLEHAIQSDNIVCIKLLVENGADVNARCKDGEPIILHAIRNENVNCIKLLLAIGVDFNDIIVNDCLVLEQMARIVLKLSVVRFLYRHVPPIRPAIKVILHKRREEAEICVELMLTPKTLLRHRPEMDTHNNRLRAALSKACKEGNEDVAVCLIQMGTDPWCAGLCVDTGKNGASPWKCSDSKTRNELEYACKRRLLIELSIMDIHGDNLFKRLRERNLDVWRICLSFLL